MTKLQQNNQTKKIGNMYRNTKFSTFAQLYETNFVRGLSRLFRIAVLIPHNKVLRVLNTFVVSLASLRKNDLNEFNTLRKMNGNGTKYCDIRCREIFIYALRAKNKEPLRGGFVCVQ